MRIDYLIELLQAAKEDGYENVLRANENLTRWGEFYTDNSYTEEWTPSGVVLVIEEEWNDAAIPPKKMELIIAHCPDWSPDEYQVCYHNGTEYTYDNLPNNMFHETVERWRYLD